MKTKILLAIAIFFLSGIAHAQYVAQTIQQRIDNDNNSITLDQTDIAAKQADIDSIVNDTSASTVTAQVPDVAAIQSSNPVIAKPDNVQSI